MTQSSKSGHGGSRHGAGAKPKPVTVDDNINIRCHRWQKLQLKANAERAGLTLTDFILERCLDDDAESL